MSEDQAEPQQDSNVPPAFKSNLSDILPTISEASNQDEEQQLGHVVKQVGGRKAQ